MFWVALIVFICVAIPVGGGFAFAAWKAALKARPVDPFEILAARFATGEIDESEYSRRLHVLTSMPQPQLPSGADGHPTV